MEPGDNPRYPPFVCVAAATVNVLRYRHRFVRG